MARDDGYAPHTITTTPRRRRTDWLRYWPVVVALSTGLVAGLAGAARLVIAVHDHLVVDEAQTAELADLREQVRKVIHVELSEHPAYTELFYPVGAK